MDLLVRGRLRRDFTSSAKLVRLRPSRRATPVIPRAKAKRYSPSSKRRTGNSATGSPSSRIAHLGVPPTRTALRLHEACRVEERVAPQDAELDAEVGLEPERSSILDAGRSGPRAAGPARRTGSRAAAARLGAVASGSGRRAAAARRRRGACGAAAAGAARAAVRGEPLRPGGCARRRRARRARPSPRRWSSSAPPRERAARRLGGRDGDVLRRVRGRGRGASAPSSTMRRPPSVIWSPDASARRG